MRHGLLLNPGSGNKSPDEKRHHFKPLIGLLEIKDCDVRGLETRSLEEFCACARELAHDVDIMVVAGGDGTIHHAMNAAPESVFAYAPAGTGNALRSSLKLPTDPALVAERIKQGRLHALDAIRWDGARLSFMGSVGFDASVLPYREQRHKVGGSPFFSYIRGGHDAYRAWKYPCTTITIDDKAQEAPHLISTIIAVQRFYGYETRVMRAGNDGALHVRAIDGGRGTLMLGAISALCKHLAVGVEQRAQKIVVTSATELPAQVDGERYRSGKEFTAEIASKTIRIVY